MCLDVFKHADAEMELLFQDKSEIGWQYWAMRVRLLLKGTRWALGGDRTPA